MSSQADESYSARVSAFIVQLMEKLNSSDDIYAPVPEVLRETGEFFEFGCGFIYKADYTSLFFLEESFLLYNYEPLPEQVDLQNKLGKELMGELANQKAVVFPAGKQLSALEACLSESFKARAMIFIPICDAKHRLIAFVALADRRGVRRQGALDLDGAYAVLCSIANHVKLQLYQQRAENASQAMHDIMDHMGIDIYVNDLNTHEILYVNQTMAAPYGGAETLIGQKCWAALREGQSEECSYCPHAKLLDEDGAPAQAYTLEFQRPSDGNWFRMYSTAFRWADGRLAHVVSCVDITENKRNELIIRQMADYDPLTGLPNRRKLLRDLDSWMAALAKGTGQGYLLFFDLDGFKRVNDELGHKSGDELLEKIGNMLGDNPLTEGISYRHGGDEFVLLCYEESIERLQKTLGSLMANFAHAWKLENGEVVCRCSIGVAHFPNDGRNTEELLNNADKAMYAAKKAGKGLVRFYAGGQNKSPEAYLASLIK